VLASISIPGVYPPQHVGGRLLVDGGVVDPVPVQPVIDSGADVVVAIRLSERPRPGTVELEASAAVTTGPSVVRSVLRAIECMQARVGLHASTLPTVLVEPVLPVLPAYGLRDFAQGERFVAAGVEAAEARLPELARVLPWLTDEGRPA
jgi:NTE family protein